MAGIMMGVGALASGGSALAGLFGGGGDRPSDVPLPQMYQNPYMGDYTSNSLGLIQGLNGANVPQQLLPQYQHTVNNIMNNPGASGAMQGAQAGGAAMQGAGLNGINYGSLLANTGMQALPYASNVAQTAFDPQSALYARERQQNSDQTNADLSARGVGTTPYGAGVWDQSNQNFNTNWQNNQLSREVQGAGAIGSILNSGGQALAGGNAMQMGGAQSIATGGLLPYSTYHGQQGDVLNALGVYGNAGTNATQLPLQQIQDYIAMMNSGNQANSVANSTAQLGLNQQQQGFNQNQIYGQNFGAALSSLGNSGMMGGGGGGMGFSPGLGPGNTGGSNIFGGNTSTFGFT